jgi:hypothetical protein
LQAMGALAYALFAARQAWILVLLFLLTSSTWLILVLATRLRNVPYVVHFLLAALWCLSGYPLVARVVAG